MKYTADTTAVINELVPIVNTALKKSKNVNLYKRTLNDFIAARSEYLYDSVPCARILCGESDMSKLYPIIESTKSDVSNIISKTYYGNIDNFNPKAAQDEFTVAQLCVIRYFAIEKNDTKMTELACIHLAFSGKFYPSLHYRSFRIPPQREVMEYVVNNELSKKFDLASQGSIIGAISSICKTWLNSYKDKLKSLSDEEVVYLVQQLHSRIGSFMKNIATIYYKVYEDKDKYMVYSSDSYDPDNFHLSDSDTLKMDRYTEKTMTQIVTSSVDYKLCKAGEDENIKATEIKAIIESIIGDTNNRKTIREFIQLTIAAYFMSPDSSKDVTDIAFITYTMSPKPNSKQKEILRSKEIIEAWLCENSTAYLRRRSRIATKNSYEKAVKMYFTLLIHNVNK